MPSPFSVRSQTNPGTDLGEWDASGNIKIPGTIRAGVLAGPVSTDIIALTLGGAATTTDVITIQLPTDGFPRMVINADGKIEWGSGIAAVDTNLSRQTGGTIITDGTFYAASGLKVGYNTVPYLNVGATGVLNFSDGANAADTNLYRSAVSILGTDDSISINTAGKGLLIKEGANARMGTAVLAGNTGVDVLTTAVTANSRIFMSVQDEPGVASGDVWVMARVPGTSFTIRAQPLINSTVAWMIVNPA